MALETLEEGDVMAVPSSFVLDRESMAMVDAQINNQNSSYNNNNNNSRQTRLGRRNGPPSLAPTELASAVGSVMGPDRTSFLKSITIFKDAQMLQLQPEDNSDADDNNNNNNNNDNSENNSNNETTKWGGTMELSDNPVRIAKGSTSKTKLLLGKTEQRLLIQNVTGTFGFSKIHEGDYLKAINGKKVLGQNWNAEKAAEQMKTSWKKDGFLNVSVGNTEGADILVQATILKPRPDMTYEEMGMVVWFWGYLCIKSIDKQNSVWRHSVLKDTDHIISVNGIECDGMKPKQFAQVVDALPLDITLTVLRRKQRVNGMFG